MDKEQLKYLLSEFLEKQLPASIPRDKRIPTGTGKVVVLTGIRRSGKTSLLFDTIARLGRDGIGRDRVIYLNFEDDRIYPVKTEELDLVLRAHAEMYPDLQKEKRFLFLDEVQAVPGWERFVRRVHDSGDWEVYVTGSSSKLLRKEMASPMRGRGLHIEVAPLSFGEFLRFRDISVEEHSRASEARVCRQLEEFLDTGGFPEVVLASPEWRDAILDEYADLVFYKDLIDGFGIGNGPVLKRMLKHCLGNPGSLFSPHKFYSDLRSQGIQVSKDTIYSYLDHLEEAFVIYPVRKWSRSHRVQAMNPVKLFTVDTGLASRFSFTPDRGKRLENLIFHKLRSRRGILHYLANGHEVDLVSCEEDPVHAWNVAWSLNDEKTRDRELASLHWARKTYPQMPCDLIAHETPEPWKKSIKLTPAWKFLLANPKHER